MRDYVIVTDSSCDLPEGLVASMELTVIPLSVTIGEQSFLNAPGVGLSNSEFYGRLRKGETAYTSSANVEEFKMRLRPLLAAGKDILYLGLSSALSGTYQNGCVAVKELQSEFPEAKLLAVDTLCASLGQGLMLDLAVQKKRSGQTIEEVRDYVEAEKRSICHWFTVADLDFLRRGGRLSAGKAIFGSLLHMKPVMHTDDSGGLTPVETVKGRRKSMEAMVAHMGQTAIAPETQRIYISHGDCLEEARELAKLVRLKMAVQEVVIGMVGPVIGAHSGPGTLALFFVGSQR